MAHTLRADWSIVGSAPWPWVTSASNSIHGLGSNLPKKRGFDRVGLDPDPVGLDAGPGGLWIMTSWIGF